MERKQNQTKRVVVVAPWLLLSIKRDGRYLLQPRLHGRGRRSAGAWIRLVSFVPPHPPPALLAHHTLARSSTLPDRMLFASVQPTLQMPSS